MKKAKRSLDTIDQEAGSHNKSIKISLVKDLISTFLSVKGSYQDFSKRDFKFLTENQSLFGVSDKEIELVQDGGNFQATYTRSRASMNAFPSRSLGTRINRFSRSQAPAWECMPRSSASSGLEISAILH